VKDNDCNCIILTVDVPAYCLQKEKIEALGAFYYRKQKTGGC
jgi:hypothetical protein